MTTTATTTGERTGRYRIGDLELVVRSDLPELLRDLDRLYGHDAEGPARARVAMEVRSRGRRRYDVIGDGEVISPSVRRREVLPYLEWGVNWRVIATRDRFLQIHAASLSRHDRGVVVAGVSGAGKSTLAAGLVRRGFAYFCDELALVDTRTLRLHPFPKALCVKAGSFDLLGRLGLPLSLDRRHVKALKGRVGYVAPGDLPPRPEARPCPVRLVLLAHHTGHEEPRHRDVPRARAAFALATHALNRHALGERVTPLVAALVRDARCCVLEGGNLEPTCDLIEELLA